MSIAKILSRDVAFIGHVPPPPPHEGPDLSCAGTVLDLTVDAQQQDNWCWATVAVGVAHAYKDPDPDWEACKVAKRVLRATNCCPPGYYAACNRTRKELNAALDGHLDPTPIDQKIDKTFDLVQNSIDKGIPIAVRVVLPNASAHFVVVSGYCVLEDRSQRIFVCDPQDGGRRREDFAGFLNGLGGKPKWDKTYLTKGIAEQGEMMVGKE